MKVENVNNTEADYPVGFYWVEVNDGEIEPAWVSDDVPGFVPGHQAAKGKVPVAFLTRGEYSTQFRIHSPAKPPVLLEESDPL